MKGILHNYHQAAGGFRWHNSKGDKLGWNVWELFVKKNLKACFVGTQDVWKQLITYRKPMGKTGDTHKGATPANWPIINRGPCFSSDPNALAIKNRP
jgi:hypothetical protein